MTGLRLGFLLSPDTTQKLIRLAQAKEVSPYDLLVAAVDALDMIQHVIQEDNKDG